MSEKLNTDSSGVWAGGLRARILKGSSALLYEKSVVILSQVLIVPILASSWGTELYGTWLMLVTLPQFLAFSDLGLSVAAGVLLTEKVLSGDADAQRKVYHTALATALALALAILVLGALAIGGWVASGPQPTVLPVGEFAQTLATLLAYGCCVLICGTLVVPLKSFGHLHLSVVWLATTLLCEALVVAASAVAGFDLVFSATALLVTRLLAIAALLALSRRKVPDGLFGIRASSRAEFNRQLGPGISAMFMPLGQIGMLQGTVLAIGWAAGPAAAATFSVVRTLSRIGLQLAAIVVRAVWFDYSAAAQSNSVDRASKLLWLGLGLTIAFCLPYTLGMLVLGEQVITLWTGGEISPAWSVVAVMAIGICFAGLWNVGFQYLAAINRLKVASLILIVIMLAEVAGAYFLAKWHGTFGGAIAFTTADIVVALVFVLIARRHLVGFSRWREAGASLKSALADRMNASR